MKQASQSDSGEEDSANDHGTGGENISEHGAYFFRMIRSCKRWQARMNKVRNAGGKISNDTDFAVNPSDNTLDSAMRNIPTRIMVVPRIQESVLSCAFISNPYPIR